MESATRLTRYHLIETPFGPLKTWAGLFQANLEAQTPKVVTKAWRWITVLFLLVQMIPFGLIGYAAYADLKSTA